MATDTDDLSSTLDEIGLNTQNNAAVGRLATHGGVGQATLGPDAKMHASVRIVADALIWEPSVVVMPHGGDLVLELRNDDRNSHCAVLPCNGDKQFIWLPVHSRGTAYLNLDGPGYYWFSSPKGNEEGRGLSGVIVVKGEVPKSFRLDRPQQPRP